MINYNKKYYWTAKKPVLIDNMLLAEDWNRYEPIEASVDVVTNLSSTLTAIFNNPIDISSYLIRRTSELIHSDSILSTVNGSYNENANGIATIKINDNVLCGSIHEYYLADGVRIVNTLNDKDGNIDSVLTGINLNGTLYSGYEVNLGNFFSRDFLYVENINTNQTGNCWVITSITLNNVEYNNIVDNYIDISLFDSLVLKRNQILENGYINNTENTNIVNLLYYNTHYQCSASIAANETKTIENVEDWISITNENYEIIQPTTAKLTDEGVLTIKSPSAGIIYYFSKVRT